MCCENVANVVACNIQHQESFFLLPPCCDYMGAMLRPVLRATSNIRSLFSLPLDSTPNIKCLQHRNATSVTLKINGHNIQHHGSSSTQHPTSHISNIKTQHPQRRKLMFVTSKYLDLILKHSHRTLATCRERECNMFTTIKHERQTMVSR
jgi:hypothetical protein